MRRRVPDALAEKLSVTGPWQRHDLLHLAPQAWALALAAHPPQAATPLLAGWTARAWPVIVRRRMPCDDPNGVPIGVPLPPAAAKLRMALTVPIEGVIRRSASVSLKNAASAAPAAWKPTVSRLVALPAEHGVEPLAFGSLMWQHQTGLKYLSPQSDLDVLWPVSRDCAIFPLLSGIAKIEEASPVCIDGEIVLADGRAVNWRELYNALRQGAPARVLVKSMDRVALVGIDQLLSGEVAV
jgi:phosphoribosyl-dephospho-CoA transferase